MTGARLPFADDVSQAPRAFWSVCYFLGQTTPRKLGSICPKIVVRLGYTTGGDIHRDRVDRQSTGGIT